MAGILGTLGDLPSDYRAALADDAVHDWKAKSTLSASVFAATDHVNTGDAPAFLIYVHDTPLQEKLGYYEERSR